MALVGHQPMDAIAEMERKVDAAFGEPVAADDDAELDVESQHIEEEIREKEKEAEELCQEVDRLVKKRMYVKAQALKRDLAQVNARLTELYRAEAQREEDLRHHQDSRMWSRMDELDQLSESQFAKLATRVEKRLAKDLERLASEFEVEAEQLEDEVDTLLEQGPKYSTRAMELGIAERKLAFAGDLGQAESVKRMRDRKEQLEREEHSRQVGDWKEKRWQALVKKYERAEDTVRRLAKAQVHEATGVRVKDRVWLNARGEYLAKKRMKESSSCSSLSLSMCTTRHANSVGLAGHPSPPPKNRSRQAPFSEPQRRRV